MKGMGLCFLLDTMHLRQPRNVVTSYDIRVPQWFPKNNLTQEKYSVAGQGVQEAGEFRSDCKEKG